MEKAKSTLDKLFTCLSALLLLVVVLILGANIVSRILGKGFAWYMEGSQFLNVWSVFLGGIALAATKGHIRIEAIDGLFKGRRQIVPTIITDLTSMAFYLCLAYAMFLLASRSRQTISTMAPLKMAYVYYPLVVLSLLGALSSLLAMLVDLKKFREDRQQ